MSDIKNKSENNSLNILKFLACFFIVGSHCAPLFKTERLNYYYCQWFFRFCVPLFFITTGYYFIKMSNEKRKSYIKRILIIYVVSTIFYLPLLIKNSYNLSNILTFIFFGYHHLWYIISLFYALLVLYFIYKKRDFIVKRHIYVVIAVLIVIGAYLDEYYKIFNIKCLNNVYLFFTKYLFGGRNFIFFAIPMLLIGMIISKNSDKIQRKKNSTIVIMTIVSFAIFLAETYYLRHNIEGIISNDITLFNYFPAIYLFILCTKIKLCTKLNTKPLRRISDIIYIVHPLIIYELTTKLNIYYIKLFILSFNLSLIFSIIIYIFINKTKKLLRFNS